MASRINCKYFAIIGVFLAGAYGSIEPMRGPKGSYPIESCTCCQCQAGNPGIPGIPGVNGPQGPIGQRGDPGLGLPGYKGQTGSLGQKGDIGEPGLKGTPGTELGPTGSKGDQGLTGIRGQTGIQGQSGSPGPRGSIGSKGEKGQPGSASASASVVAFSASLRLLFEGSKGDIIVFDEVEANVGDGYDAQTGLFTCSVSGVYYFSVSLTSLGQTARPWANLKRNGDLLFGVYDSHPSYHHQPSNSVVTVLAAGDTVWLETKNSGRTIDGNNNKLSRFSGFLIHEM